MYKRSGVVCGRGGGGGGGVVVHAGRAKNGAIERA